MKYYHIFLSLCMLSGRCQALDAQEIWGGTIVVAAKAKDGIIIGADSRTYHGQAEAVQKRAIGFYSDGHIKVFKAGRYLVGVVGLQGYRNFSMQKLIDSFLTSKPAYTHPADFLNKFGEFIKARFNGFLNDIVANGDLVCVGYYGGKARIAHAAEGIIHTNDGNGFYASIGGIPPNSKFKIDTTRSSEKQKIFVKDFIEQYPYVGDSKIIIGGPTLLARIDKNNNVTWLTPMSKFHLYYYTMDYLKALLTHKLRVTIVDKDLSFLIMGRLREMYEGRIPLE